VVVRVVVADNGSRDGSVELASSLGATVVQERVKSSYAARNRALAEVTADWVAFTDADCEPEPTWLASAVERLVAEGADLAGGRVRHHSSQTLPGRHDALTYLDQEAHVLGGFAATANLVVRRAVVEATGGFDAARQSGGDLDFCSRARAAGFTLVYAPDAVVWHEPRETWRGVLKKAWRVSTAHGRMIANGELSPRYWVYNPRLFIPARPVREQGPAMVATDLVVSLTQALGRLVGYLQERSSRRRG
jgi:GT2 family glycosyltransferase